MPADALAPKAAKASAGMVLTPKTRTFRLQHQKSYRRYVVFDWLAGWFSLTDGHPLNIIINLFALHTCDKIIELLLNETPQWSDIDKRSLSNTSISVSVRYTEYL